MSEGITPANPLCPICGEADWYSYPDAEWGLVTLLRGTGTPLSVGGEANFLSVAVFVCRGCRFVRLQAPYGDLDMSAFLPS
jgi:hypothetical protein